MLDIFKLEKLYYKWFLYFIKKKHQTASPENLHFLTKKNRNALDFMLE